MSEHSTRHIAFVVAYDGGGFCGSQRQTNGPSIQGELENALERVLQHPAPVTLAGRTDAGVHALGQCGRFTTTNRIPAERVPFALNAVLNRAIRVRSAREVDESFHPRYSAKSRVYRYTIENAVTANPLTRGIVGNVREPLELDTMRAVAQELVGRHDFAAWQSAGSPARTTVREVKKLEIRRRRDVFGSAMLEIEIEADAFLYQMVRNIVGALIEAGQGKLHPGDIQRLTQGRDRTLCPPPAPPQGLCLLKVKY